MLSTYFKPTMVPCPLEEMKVKYTFTNAKRLISSWKCRTKHMKYGT